MNSRKIFSSCLFIVLAVIIIFLFWEKTILTSLALIGLTLIKHKLFPIKLGLIWFAIAGILGAVAESIIIFSGAWHYAQPQVVNIPLWLPLVWGFTGLNWITFYEGVTKKP